MAELNVSDVKTWARIITDFPGYYKNFQENYNALIQQYQFVKKYPDLLAEYRRLLEEGNKTYSKLYTLNENIQKLKSIWGSVTAWFRSVTGLGEMGIAPVIWAGMAAGTALGIFSSVGKYLTEVRGFASRVEEAKRLEAMGKSPEEVTRIIRERYGVPGSEVTFFGIPLKLILFGGLALLALPLILQSMRR